MKCEFTAHELIMLHLGLLARINHLEAVLAGLDPEKNKKDVRYTILSLEKFNELAKKVSGLVNKATVKTKEKETK